MIQTQCGNAEKKMIPFSTFITVPGCSRRLHWPAQSTFAGMEAGKKAEGTRAEMIPRFRDLDNEWSSG